MKNGIKEMLLKKSKTKPIKEEKIAEDINQDSFTFESYVTYMTEKSNRRAWTIAFISMGLTILSWAALVGLMPLKEVIPYVIRVDSATGVPDIVTALNETTLETDEALDKYFVNKYIKLRESYFYETLQRDFELVQLMGSTEVNDEFLKIYQGENSRDKQLGSRFKIEAQVLSIVPSKSNGVSVATSRVRIKKSPKNGKGQPTEETYVITLSYEYLLENTLLEAYRMENPFAFTVTSYRADREY
jgi:type IV secretion system protein VirB8